MFVFRASTDHVQVLHISLQLKILEHHRVILLSDNGDVLHVHGGSHEDEYACTKIFLIKNKLKTVDNMSSKGPRLVSSNLDYFRYL